MRFACFRPTSCGLAASLLALSVALAACGDKSAPGSASAPASATSGTASADAGGNILRIASSSKDKGTLAIESDASYPLLQSGATETLVTVTLDGQAHPALATQWKRTGDTTWEFDLRAGVQFHDGSSLDADTVVNALRYIMQAATPPRSLKGTGLVAEAVDADTVKLTTAKPDPVLPLRLGSPSTAILAKGAYASNPMNPIGFGSGPYKISQYEPGVGMTLVRFDAYWGGKPQLDGVELRAIVDAAARFNALKVGEVHVAHAIAPNNILEAKQNSALRVDHIELPRASTLYTNFTKPALKHEKIRQAMDLLIDREAIATAVLEGTGTPAAGYFGGTPWAPKAAARPADYLEQAKRLIAESGLQPEALKLNLMTYTGRPELAAVANVIKDNLEQGGFSITLDVVDYNTVLEPKMLAKEHDLILLSRSFYTDMPDAAGFLASDFGCEGSYNLNVFCDKAFDALLQEAAAAEQAATRTAHFAKAAQFLIDHKVGLPVYNDTSRRVFSARVKDGIHDPLDQRLVTHTTSLTP